ISLLVLVLASAPEAVVLLGEVDELEVGAEGPQDECLAVEVELRHGGAKSTQPSRAPGRPRRSREGAHALLEVEELGALLFDEDASERVAEQTDVASQRRVRGRLVPRRHSTEAETTRSESGSARVAPEETARASSETAAPRV